MITINEMHLSLNDWAVSQMKITATSGIALSFFPGKRKSGPKKEKNTVPLNFSQLTLQSRTVNFLRVEFQSHYQLIQKHEIWFYLT